MSFVPAGVKKGVRKVETMMQESGVAGEVSVKYGDEVAFLIQRACTHMHTHMHTHTHTHTCTHTYTHTHMRTHTHAHTHIHTHTPVHT